MKQIHGKTNTFEKKICWRNKRFGETKTKDRLIYGKTHTLESKHKEKHMYEKNIYKTNK